MKKIKILEVLVAASTLVFVISACQSQNAVVTATPEPFVAKTFSQMVAEAMDEVPVISPEEAQRRIAQDPNILVIDPRDAADIPYTGIIPGAMNISYGSLTWKADQEVPPEWREPELQDRSRPIIMACETGELSALSGKLLQDMGFTNVSVLEGGTVAWKDAGFPVDEFEPGS